MQEAEFIAGLGAVPRTALITLMARARAAQILPSARFDDGTARAIARGLQLPADLFGDDPRTQRMVLRRTMWMDRRARAFFATHPDGLGISLGAGLNTSFDRIDNGRLRWVDIDLPEMVALRARLLPTHARRKDLAHDITDHGWMTMLGRMHQQPTLVQAEGVLMYLPPDAAPALLDAMARAFAGAPFHLLFDWASPRLVRGYRNKLVAQAGASFTWGLEDPAALPGYSFVGRGDPLTDLGWVARLVVGLMQRLRGREFYGWAELAGDARAAGGQV